MATKEEIIAELQAETRNLDPTLDVEFGPLLNIFITPFATKLEDQDSKLDRLDLLYSTQFAEALSSDELEAMAYSFGITRLPGEKATGTVTFVVTGIYSGYNITIPVGTVVSTSDGTYSFLTTETVNTTQAEISTKYNPQLKGYEIDVPVEAEDYGEDYRVAPYTISRLDSPLNIIAKVHNKSWTTGGSDIESDESLVSRLQIAAQAKERGTINGLESDIRDFSVLVKDVQVAPQIYGSPSIKAYIIGGSRFTTTQTFVGQREMELTTIPVIEINSVLVNDVELLSDQYTLTEDYNTFTITLATDISVTSTTTVVIDYTYNSLVSNIQNTYLEPNTDLFSTSVLVREAVEVGMNISCIATLQAGIDKNTTERAISSAIFEAINTETFVDYLYPIDIRRTIEKSVAGIASFSFTTFNRLDAANTDLLAEVVEFAEGEYPWLESANLEIVIQ